jgi:hypothetical protein
MPIDTLSKLITKITCWGKSPSEFKKWGHIPFFGSLVEGGFRDTCLSTKNYREKMLLKWKGNYFARRGGLLHTSQEG